MERDIFFPVLLLEGVEWLHLQPLKKTPPWSDRGSLRCLLSKGGARAGERLNEPNDKPQEAAEDTLSNTEDWVSLVNLLSIQKFWIVALACILHSDTQLA